VNTILEKRIFIILGDMPHFVRRDIFALAKVILHLWHSDIIFASSTAARQYHSAKPNITAKQYNSLQGEYN